MARYKWDSAADWLGDKINGHIEAARVDVNALAATIAQEAGVNLRSQKHDRIRAALVRGLEQRDGAVADLANIANGIVNGGLDMDSDTIQDAYQDEMDEDGFFIDLDICNNLSREACVDLLTGAGIECYDDEDVATLRKAVEANIQDGTLSYGDVQASVIE